MIVGVFDFFCGFIDVNGAVVGSCIVEVFEAFSSLFFNSSSAEVNNIYRIIIKNQLLK